MLRSRAAPEKQGVQDLLENSATVSGMLSKTHSEPVAGNTLFEIGSVTKVLTSTLLSSAVDSGLLELNSRLSDILPDLSDFMQEISLLQLATHTSGLPRLPPRFIWSIVKRLV